MGTTRGGGSALPLLFGQGPIGIDSLLERREEGLSCLSGGFYRVVEAVERERSYAARE